jgi:hypothetical protein
MDSIEVSDIFLTAKSNLTMRFAGSADFENLNDSSSVGPLSDDDSAFTPSGV